MWPDRVSNPGPLALESDALLTAARGPAQYYKLLISRTLISQNNLFEVPQGKEFGRISFFLLTVRLILSQTTNISK